MAWYWPFGADEDVLKPLRELIKQYEQQSQKIARRAEYQKLWQLYNLYNTLFK